MRLRAYKRTKRCIKSSLSFVMKLILAGVIIYLLFECFAENWPTLSSILAVIVILCMFLLKPLLDMWREMCADKYASLFVVLPATLATILGMILLTGLSFNWSYTLYTNVPIGFLDCFVARSTISIPNLELLSYKESLDFITTLCWFCSVTWTAGGVLRVQNTEQQGSEKTISNPKFYAKAGITWATFAVILSVFSLLLGNYENHHADPKELPDICRSLKVKDH